MARRRRRFGRETVRQDPGCGTAVPSTDTACRQIGPLLFCVVASLADGTPRSRQETTLRAVSRGCPSDDSTAADTARQARTSRRAAETGGIDGGQGWSGALIGRSISAGR